MAHINKDIYIYIHILSCLKIILYNALPGPMNLFSGGFFPLIDVQTLASFYNRKIEKFAEIWSKNRGLPDS